MDTAIRLTLWVHVLAGTVALVVAPIALMTVKGGPTHRRWGKVYFWAMAVVAATAIVVAYWRSILFLMLTAVFSFYAALSGYRVLYRKRPDLGQRPSALDWTAAGDHARRERDPGSPRHHQADAQIPGALHGRHRLRLRRARHRRRRRPAVRPPAGRQAGVVVQAHGEHDRVLHRGRHGLLRGELPRPADDAALALADHGRHAPHRDLDHLLQAPLQRRRRARCSVAALGSRSTYAEARLACSTSSALVSRPSSTAVASPPTAGRAPRTGPSRRPRPPDGRGCTGG